MPLDDRIRWLAFDAVGTLIFADPPVHIVYYRVGRRFGSQLAPQEVRARFREAFALRAAGWDPSADVMGDQATSETIAGAAGPDGETAERRFWSAVVADVLPDVSDPQACFEELFAYFARPTAWTCFADVEETFSEARQRGLQLAIASNFDARLHAICDGKPELSGVTQRVISSEVGSRKPDSAFYGALLDACECGPEELLMIGDDPAADVEGARRAGIQALQIDRSGNGGEGVLTSLCDLWDVTITP
jgi:putative hydrolase of the HAD superfamily